MTVCPNCGSELRFDISSQMLKCPSCDSLFRPEEVKEGKAAEESHSSEAEAPSVGSDIAQDSLTQQQTQQNAAFVQSGQNGPSAAYGQPGQLGPQQGQFGPSPGYGPSGQAGYAQPGGYGGQAGQPGMMAGAMAGGMAGGMASQQYAQPGAYGGQAGQPGMMAGAMAGGPASQQYAQPGGYGGQAGQPGMMAGAMAGGMAGGMAAQQYGQPGGYGGQAGQPGMMAGVMAGGGIMPQGTFIPGQGQAATQGGYTEAQTETAAAGVGAEEEQKVMDVISYSCPQCGGTIYSTEESVNGFCSYCGSSVMLNARMARMPQPKKLISFRVDKNGCKEAYRKHVGKTLFTPKELRDPEYLDHFRGIYMPYWVYDMDYQGPLNLNGKKSYRRGNYVYTEHYKCSCIVNAYYRGLSYDASASFDDYFSQGIAPFDAHTMVDFNSNYMSGYYADLADVPGDVYVGDAMVFAGARIFENVKQKRVFPGVTIDAAQAKSIRTVLEGGKPYTAFFPVWFLSFRKNDRVAYAVVNGQTGKVVSDLPVDNRKFLLLGLIISILMYGVLALFRAMKPTNLLTVCSFFSIINMILLLSVMNKVIKREQHEDDKGFLSKNDPAAYRKKQVKDRSSSTTASSVFGIVFVIVSIVLSMGTEVFFVIASVLGSELVALAVGVVTIIMTIMGISKAGKLSSGGGIVRIGFILMCICMGFNVIISMSQAASDMLYYGGVFAILAVTIFCQMAILKQYNLLTTRPLPQLNRKGGDDSAPV